MIFALTVVSDPYAYHPSCIPNTFHTRWRNARYNTYTEMESTKKVKCHGRRTECVYQKDYFTVLSETACCWSSPTLPMVLKNHNCVIQLLKNFKVNFQIMKFGFLRNLLSLYVSMFDMANGKLLLWSTLLLIQHYKCMWHLETNKTKKELTT